MLENRYALRSTLVTNQFPVGRWHDLIGDPTLATRCSHLSFLHRIFVLPNERLIPQTDHAEVLEDELFGLRENQGGDAFLKSALGYLNDWAGVDKAWSSNHSRTSISSSRSSTVLASCTTRMVILDAAHPDD